MTTRADYNSEEWATLQDAPFIVGGTIMAVSHNGIFNALKEAFALLPTVINTGQQFPNNTLIQALLPTNDEGHGERTRHEAPRQFKGEAALSYGIETCRKVADVLALKSSDQEATEFKQWLLSIADGMLQKSKSSSLPGFGGKRRHQEGVQAVQELANTLGLGQ